MIALWIALVKVFICTTFQSIHGQSSDRCFILDHILRLFKWGKIYLVGGETDVYNNYSFNSTELFDTLKQTCTAGPDLPNTLNYFSAAAVGKKLYLIGGADFENNQTFNSLYMLDTVSYTSWQPKMPLPEPRNSMCANVINGKIYLTGGITSSVPVIGEESDQDFLAYYP